MIVQVGWLLAATAGVVAVVWVLLASARLGPPSLRPGEAFDAWPAARPGGVLALLPILGGALQSLQAQAGNRAPPSAILLLSVLGGAASLQLGGSLHAPLWASAGASLLALSAPFVVLDLHRRRRSDALSRDLPATLRSLSRLVGSGEGVQSAMRDVAGTQRGTLSQELGRVAEEQAAGRPLPEALNAMAARAPRCVELRILATAVDLAGETSLDLASLLRRIEERLSERAKRLAEARARTSRARTQVAIVVAMVPLAAGLIFLAEPSYLIEGWADPLGRALYQAAGLWSALGLLVIGALLRSQP